MSYTYNAISFCEVAHAFKNDKEYNVSLYQKILDSIHVNEIERLYIGSSFCCRYFLHFTPLILNQLQEMISFKGYKFKITLVLPIFSEVTLTKGKELIKDLLEKYPSLIDEVTVNDFGMLEYISKLNIKINVGRLMNKDTRDIRQNDYYNIQHTPDILSYQVSIFDRYNINRFEIDVTNRFLNLDSEKIKFSVYAPFVYATTGNVCEYASIDKPLNKKFRTNDECHYHCTYTHITYHDFENNIYVKYGRTVYFEVEDFEIRGEDYRLIFEPFEAINIIKGEEINE